MRIIAAFLLLASFSVVAKPVIEQKYKYYYVKPQGQRALLPTMNRMSPIRIDGEVMYAKLDSKIEWHYKFQQVRHGCELASVGTKVKLLYTLPKLKSDSVLVKRIWNQWYPNLLKHEDGHKANAINVANKIETELKMLPGASNCKQLGKAAESIGNRWIAELHKLDANYDRDTNHGESQGASLVTYLR